MGISDPGSFCWFELGTSDQPAAVTFYRSLFHWDVNESPMGPGEIYSMFTFRGLDAAAALHAEGGAAFAGCSAALDDLRRRH